MQILLRWRFARLTFQRIEKSILTLVFPTDRSTTARQAARHHAGAGFGHRRASIAARHDPTNNKARNAGPEKTVIPTPYYTLIETSIGKDPAIVVVNSSLRIFNERDAFPWHLRISVDCKLQGTNGMPTTEEGEVLNRLESSIATPLLAEQNAIFLARITARGQRVLLYRVHDPEIANNMLEALVSVPEPLREWDYEMEPDPDWNMAQPELHLLEHDKNFN